MATQIQTEERFEGDVPAYLPLALLEAVRAHDRPAEVLEDEDLTVSLPRRFGLTGVVETQIARYEAAQRAGRSVRLDEVVALFRLVLRRPDAGLIMHDTGRRFATWHFERRPASLRNLYPRLPARLSTMFAARAIRKALHLLNAGTSVHVHRSPFHVSIENCIFPRVDSSGAACALLTGLLEAEWKLFTGTTVSVAHDPCSAEGRARCEWRVG